MFETTKLPHWLLHNWVLHCIVAEAALCVWLQLGRTLASRVGIRVNQTWIDFFKASLSISKSTFQTYWFFLRNIQNIHDFGAIKRSKHCMRSARDRFLYIWPPPHVLGLRFEKVLTVTFLSVIGCTINQHGHCIYIECSTWNDHENIAVDQQPLFWTRATFYLFSVFVSSRFMHLLLRTVVGGTCACMCCQHRESRFVCICASTCYTIDATWSCLVSIDKMCQRVCTHQFNDVIAQRKPWKWRCV